MSRQSVFAINYRVYVLLQGRQSTQQHVKHLKRDIEYSCNEHDSIVFNSA